MKTETEKLLGDIKDTEMNLSKALSGTDYVNIGYKLVDPIRDLQEKVQKSCVYRFPNLQSSCQVVPAIKYL